VGITTIVDRDAGAGDIGRYAALRSRNRLPTRVAISHSVDASQDLDKVLQAIRTVAKHPLTAEDSQLRIVGIKTYLDGGMLTGSALMREPWGVSSIYRIDDPEYRGVRFIPSEKLTAIVREAVTNRLQFTAHSVGDGAVHALLDAYAEVNRELSIRDTRPCITHCNFMSAEAIDSMVKLGVVADIQPVWLYLDARTLHAQFGNERLRFFQPLQSIFQAGAIAGGGSDHMQKIGSLRAINPYNPFLGIATAVTRRAKWFESALHTEQALTRSQALRFYTRNNAYIAFLDKEVGSLEVGKLGDCVILDRDILTCPDDEIRDTTAIATFVGGNLVAGSLDGLLKQ
jgi:predicted amidohydrolase YtcJ